MNTKIIAVIIILCFLSFCCKSFNSEENVSEKIGPIPLTKIIPEYPDTLYSSGLQDTVIVKIFIGEDGIPRKTEIVQGKVEAFKKLSTEAAMKWIFEPGKMNGKPIKTWVTVPFYFYLKPTFN